LELIGGYKMNNKTSFSVIIFLSLLFIACGDLDQTDDINNEEPNYLITVKGVNQTSGWNSSSALKDMRFLKLQSKDGLLISGTYKLVISGRRVYLFDRRINVIFVFGLDGKFLYKIDGPNNGYAERFEYLMDFAISEVSKDVVTIDYNARKLYLFDSLGRLKKEFKSDYFASNIFEIADGIWAIKNRGTDSPETPHVLYFLDDEFGLLDKSFIEETIMGNSDISDVNPFFDYQGETRLSYGLGNKIYNVSLSGVSLNSIVDFGTNDISSEILQKTPLRQLMPEFKRGKNAGLIGDYMETEDQIFFSFYQGGEENYRGRKGIFYSKTDRQVKVVTKRIRHDLGFSIPWPQTVSDGYYVSVFDFYSFFEEDPQVFNARSRRDSVSKEFGWLDSFEELLPLINEPDSPVLMFYKLALDKE
jgi:hypothetical protein